MVGITSITSIEAYCKDVRTWCIVCTHAATVAHVHNAKSQVRSLKFILLHHIQHKTTSIKAYLMVASYFSGVLF